MIVRLRTILETELLRQVLDWCCPKFRRFCVNRDQYATVSVCLIGLLYMPSHYIIGPGLGLTIFQPSASPQFASSREFCFIMSDHGRNLEDQSDRPTLPAIRDLFGGWCITLLRPRLFDLSISEELSQLPRPRSRPPRPSVTDSPTLLFSRLSCCDEGGQCSQPIADDCRSSRNHAERLERSAVQVRILKQVDVICHILWPNCLFWFLSRDLC